MGRTSSSWARGTRRHAILVWAVLPLALAVRVHSADLLIQHARLIDGTGAPARNDVAILIRDDRIAALGDDASAAAELPTIDAAGATVIPGLIDAHVHLTAAPGTGFRGDTAETIHQLNAIHLRAYLACGVTTIFDPIAKPEVVRDVQAWLAAGNPGPTYYTTGPAITVPGGYPGLDTWGPVQTPAQVEAKLDLIQSLGAIGVKLGIETTGTGYGARMYPPEIGRAIMDGAARRKLPLYIHATTEVDQQLALDLGAHAIMHPVMGGHWRGSFVAPSDLSDQFVERMVRTHTYQLTTFAPLDTWPVAFAKERLDDPLVRLVVPEIELATARDPAAERYFVDVILGLGASWLPQFLRPWVAPFVWSRENLREGLEYSQRNVRKLHAAGVPIVAATDAPSPWPEAIYLFHGPATLRELELLGEAGLSPMESLAAATRVPAQMLGLDTDVGTVEVGKRADLVVIDGDPLGDLRALRRIRLTIKGGVARTPAEWMTASRR